MRASRIATGLFAWLWWTTLGAHSVLADAKDVFSKARGALTERRPADAAALLEDFLPEAGPDLGPAVVLLRQAYVKAADQAESSGRAAAAREYRENLEILNRKMRAKPPAVASEPAQETPPSPIKPAAAAPRVDPEVKKAALIPETPKAVEARPAVSALPPIEAPPPLANDARPPVAPEPLPSEPTPIVANRPDPSTAPLASTPISIPKPLDEPVEIGTPVSLPQADDAFREGRYEEAGRLYAKLAERKALPEARRPHWAYCRSKELVRRINAKPSNAAEWASIEEEIRRIQELSPKNWYAEYLRNLVAERSGKASPRKNNGIVVRGASPDDDAPDPAASPAPASPPVRRPSRTAPVRTPSPGASKPSPPLSSQLPLPRKHDWEVLESENFRLFHHDAQLAEQVARSAERYRVEQFERWTGRTSFGTWTARCELYLHVDGESLQEATGLPPDSPGFSTVTSAGTLIQGRKIHVRGDHRHLLTAVLPHEVTHVVAADLLPAARLPRWADEGMAVLAEPVDEQHRRALDLENALTDGRMFPLERLLVMDYPSEELWGLYYAQSVSLTRYLVELGGPTKFVEFLREFRSRGAEAELKRLYDISDLDDLKSRWLTRARTLVVSESLAESSDPT